MSSPPPPTSQYKYNKLAAKSFSNKCNEKNQVKKDAKCGESAKEKCF